MSQMKELYREKSEKHLNSDLLYSDQEMELIESFVNPVDYETEFYLEARKHFEKDFIENMSQDTYEKLEENFLLDKILQKRWVNLEGTYYNSLDVENAFKLSSLEESDSDPYDLVTKENCEGLK